MQVRTATHLTKFPSASFASKTNPMGSLSGGTHLTLRKGEALFDEGDEAEYFYQVVSGAIRSYKLLSDGRRQIDAFHLRGDIFGLEAGTDHRFSAEAVGDVSIIAYRRSRLDALIRDDAAFRDKIMTATLRCLERAQAHMLLLGRKTADEKIATFLLDMAERISKDDEQFELPMQRSDIADHLGLTIETVSRILSRFARSGLIRLLPAGRSIGLCNRMALQGLNA
jgi:CRP/FNR family nitrogen fixation transcriptional regulator